VEVLWNRLDSSDDRKFKTWLKNAIMNMLCVLERLYVCTDIYIYIYIALHVFIFTCSTSFVLMENGDMMNSSLTQQPNMG